MSSIRVIQGFPEEKGCFWLPRALATPPLSLQRMIFPWVEEWQERIRTEPSVQTICGEGFARLLVELRTIILQDDAVLLRQLGTHEMFKSAEFVSFAENLNRSMAKRSYNFERHICVLSHQPCAAHLLLRWRSVAWLNHIKILSLHPRRKEK